jgi:SIR2-like domain
MNKDYEIEREILHIQQALSQSKRPMGFLLCAGCPLSIRIDTDGGTGTSKPLINDIAGLTKSISAVLSGADGNETNWDKLLKTFQDDEINEPNIEDILTRVRALRNIAGNGVVRSLKKKDLEELDDHICQLIAEEVDKRLPSKDSPFHNLAQWARSVKRDKPVHIFTTNYDLLLEQALEESRTRYFDGFVGARRGFFDLGAVEEETSLPPSWTRVWKLHGSVNWKLISDDGHSEVVRTDEVNPKNKFLIFPSHLKYDESRKMPYLAMVDRLKAFLMMPSSVMFISGYSFGDEHINDVICRALEANPTAMVYALMFGNLNDGTDRYADAIRCAKRTPNLSLIAKDKGIIGREIRSWVSRGWDPLTIPDGVLKLSNIDTEDGDSKPCECELGDFVTFGALLKNVSGPMEYEAHND